MEDCRRNIKGKLEYKVACATCGGDVWRTKGELNRNKNSYCSRNCMSIYHSNNRSGKNSPNYLHNKIRECIECGRGITKGSETGLCKSCAKKGDRAYQWKGGTSTFLKQIRNLYEYKMWMQKVKDRDDQICQHCFSEDHIEVHHIKELKQIVKENNIENINDAKACMEMWDIDNGKCLCVHCHAEEHPDMRNAILTRLKVV